MQLGDQVCVCREASRKSVGSLKVTKIRQKFIFITDGLRTKEFNISSVLPISRYANNPRIEHDTVNIQ